MSANRPSLVVEDDPFLRLIGVVLDPATDPQRIAAYADFFAHDLPDFAGWLQQLRRRLPKLHPAKVTLVDDLPALHAALPGADFAVVEALPLGRDELAIAPRLKAVQKYGAIPSSIDAAACAARSVPVLTIRRRANIACAEHAFALMLGLSRRLHEVSNRISTASLQAAGFSPRTYDRRHTANSNWARVPGISLLHGSTLGIVGLGEIGRELAVRGAAFGMNILYHQRTRLQPDIEARHSAHYAGLDTLLGTSDWIVICLPGNNNTRGLFDAGRFARMKPGARLINISRPEIVDRDALIGALRSGRLGGFALDPLYEAPGRDDDELLTFNNVLITPHIAAQPRFNALDDIADLITGLEEKF